MKTADFNSLKIWKTGCMRHNFAEMKNKHNMKKFTTLTIICIFSVLMLSANTLGNHIRIVIKTPTSQNPTKKPRNIEFIPIQCIYDCVNHYVSIEFIENIGNVCIELTNLSTGEMAIEYVSSGDGYVIVPVSGTSGEYMLRISTDNDDVYEGTFTVE